MSGLKITDDMIKKYCEHINYKLESICKISFTYEKPDGSRHALLKAAAAPGNIRGDKRE